MEKIMWYLGGLAHSLIHPDSSFFTLKEAGFGQAGAMALIVMSNAIWISVLYQLNRFGLFLTRKKIGKSSDKLHKWSTGAIRSYGYAGMAVLCVIPYFPGLRELAIMAGLLFKMKYTLPVVILFNSLRVITLSKFHF